ncbi:CZB domain-containing protein [Marinobacter xestospongiae]|uniref:CZB domain-containing protein n=1 Tax=Marinobacter xestospongiae TaxID=994319 RepID=UPI0020058EF2|nr:CZB domain-containing protein [Marinobacter xestospongiae]MCK7566018.1 CZB domain-containing protein [Marinobacter xestospongiae]
MNQKTVIVQELRAARQGHIRWVRYASALISGMEVLKDHVPVVGTDCRFGRWYYGAGAALTGLESYRNIEQPHLNLHDMYMEIFKLLFDDDNRASPGFFGRLLGRSSTQKNARTEKARARFADLEAVSQVILKHLEQLESDVLALSDAEIERLFYTAEA